jgi:hypothetical protein
MSVFSIDLTGVDWLYIAERYGLIFFLIVIATLALMFGAGLLFWTHYPRPIFFHRNVKKRAHSYPHSLVRITSSSSSISSVVRSGHWVTMHATTKSVTTSRGCRASEEAQRGALATMRRFNATPSAKGYV